MSGSIVSQLSSNNRQYLPTFKGLDYLDNGNRSALQSPVSPQPDYTTYEDRLKSYTNFPNNDISKELLAKAGFFYTKHHDIVKCPFCNVEGHQWMAGDNPMEDHRSWSEDCPFVMTSVEPDSPRSSGSGDTCGLYGVEILPNSLPEDDVKLERLGIHKSKGPAHPDKCSYELRIATFSTWPKSIKQRPKQLADAGFYYVGTGDQTVCFHCGGGLKDWEENDDPWEQHALWFPKCSYLFLQKGTEYINDVKQRADPRVNSSQSASIKTKETSSQEAESSSTSTTEPSTSEPSDKETSDRTLCKICYKNDVGVAFLPCRHFASCVECSMALKNCAVCRKPVEATMRVFFS